MDGPTRATLAREQLLEAWLDSDQAPQVPPQQRQSDTHQQLQQQQQHQLQQQQQQQQQPLLLLPIDTAAVAVHDQHLALGMGAPHTPQLEHEQQQQQQQHVEQQQQRVVYVDMHVPVAVAGMAATLEANRPRLRLAMCRVLTCPLVEAAYRMSISPTSLKKLARSVGVTQWPYRAAWSIVRRLDGALEVAGAARAPARLYGGASASGSTMHRAALAQQQQQQQQQPQTVLVERTINEAQLAHVIRHDVAVIGPLQTVLGARLALLDVPSTSIDWLVWPIARLMCAGIVPTALPLQTPPNAGNTLSGQMLMTVAFSIDSALRRGLDAELRAPAADMPAPQHDAQAQQFVAPPPPPPQQQQQQQQQHHDPSQHVQQHAHQQQLAAQQLTVLSSSEGDSAVALASASTVAAAVGQQHLATMARGGPVAGFALPGVRELEALGVAPAPGHALVAPRPLSPSYASSSTAGVALRTRSRSRSASRAAAGSRASVALSAVASAGASHGAGSVTLLSLSSVPHRRSTRQRSASVGSAAGAATAASGFVSTTGSGLLSAFWTMGGSPMLASAPLHAAAAGDAGDDNDGGSDVTLVTELDVGGGRAVDPGSPNTFVVEGLARSHAKRRAVASDVGETSSSAAWSMRSHASAPSTAAGALACPPAPPARTLGASPANLVTSTGLGATHALRVTLQGPTPRGSSSVLVSGESGSVTGSERVTLVVPGARAVSADDTSMSGSGSSAAPSSFSSRSRTRSDTSSVGTRSHVGAGAGAGAAAAPSGWRGARSRTPTPRLASHPPLLGAGSTHPPG